MIQDQNGILELPGTGMGSGSCRRAGKTSIFAVIEVGKLKKQGQCVSQLGKVNYEKRLAQDAVKNLVMDGVTLRQGLKARTLIRELGTRPGNTVGMVLGKGAQGSIKNPKQN